MNTSTGPPINERGPAANGAPPDTSDQADADTAKCSGTDRQRYTSTHELDWHAVAVFAAPLLARIGSWPVPGSLEWIALPDSDPCKLAAVIAVGRYWVFDAACRQDTKREASQAISGAADWGAIANEIRRRSA
jgi:Protein of unknown function (DUF2742)